METVFIIHALKRQLRHQADTTLLVYAAAAMTR